MNIIGLNKLAMAPPPPKGQGAASSKEGSSFEDALGQVQTSNDAKKTSPPAQNPASKTPPAQSRMKTPAPAPEDANAASIPTQPSAPILENPTFTERLLPTPNEMPLVNPMAKPSVAMAKDDETVDSLTRRAVWSQFLRKMKDELGVSAEDVLNAFDSLSPEDLAKPPQQTVDKVVMALGLDPQATQVAKQHFMELITRTQARSLGEELSNSEKQISLTLMSQREVERKTQNKAIDNLNQNFFMKGPYERPTAAPAADANGLPITGEEAQLAARNDNTAAAGGMVVPKDLAPAANARKPQVDVDTMIKKFTEGQGQSTKVSSEAEPQPMMPVLAQAAIPANAPPPPAESTTVSASAAARTATTSGSETLAALNAIFSPASSGRDADQDMGEDSQFTRDASYLATGLAAEGQSLAQNAGPSEFQQQLNGVAPNQPMAVPDLVKNAQVMVRDGGGEMKVTLTPEGLGEVAMKVSVKDGKVNVQMITESDEAKRMIERGLGDLKSQLEQSQLQVTDIKIDTASSLGKQLEQQYQDAQRQMAQQTLEQYRQDHQGWRRSHFEVPGAKVYKNQAEAPRDTQAPTTLGARSRGGSRRLDLVA